ncbi:bifunctional 2-polyprenyl-6-hydroxyphenol methylase/3-demethylubiquinol 3-O-methyltransferase UbiG [Acidovorax sp. MR-S7]|uniref:class I SAM-dependent methyltransferase n=1 Tax=unclassified Acidovorax TaxID=2684926 RepID=UPI000372B9A3|nr:class I SAM-dependent methyltransferase [Acidovorax sp. MR-S7]GAD20304.1 hypothetical protein AVS7_00065 [Acidovorax sp. MR-S7]
MSNIERYDYAFDPEGEDWAARLIRQLPPPGAVLELGPGPGAMTKVLVERGYQVTAVENDPQALEALQSLGVQVIEGDLERADWLSELAGRRFHAILACDVLEHLHQPEALLQNLAGCLEPSGRLVVSVPNIAYAGVVAALRNGVFDYADKGQLDRTHVRFLTKRSAEKMLLDAGWVPRYWGANRIPVTRSEFAWCWNGLTDGLRQELQCNWPDFDVYQWMVVATPSHDGHVAEAAHERFKAERLRHELHALKAVHDQEHASLLEHQKAFAEAKVIIARLEAQQASLQSAMDAASEASAAEKRTLQTDLEQLRAEVSASQSRWWLLRRLLGRR